MQKIVFSPKLIENLKEGSAADPLTAGLSVLARQGVPVVFSFKRKVKGTNRVFKKVLGSYPAMSIADARQIAAAFNLQLEAGIDPREAAKEEAVAGLTVDDAHDLYMDWCKSGLRKTLKPRTIEDKERLWRVSKDSLVGRPLRSITERDLRDIVRAKADEGSKIRANRMAAEFKVFFGWCCGMDGEDAGVTLDIDPARRLSGTYYGVSSRSRILSEEEIVLLLRAVAEQERVYIRAICLILLTGCRRSEVMSAPTDERRGDLWTIPASRYKSNIDHVIPLAPWMLSLMQTNTKWLIPAKRGDAALTEGWINKVLEKVRVRMMELGECVVPHFTIHDLRRTLRSNTKRLKIDSDTAEAMIGHKKRGLVEIYDRYDMIDEKRAGFAKWEAKLVGMARGAGVAEALGIPTRL